MHRVQNIQPDNLNMCLLVYPAGPIEGKGESVKSIPKIIPQTPDRHTLMIFIFGLVYLSNTRGQVENAFALS